MHIIATVYSVVFVDFEKKYGLMLLIYFSTIDYEERGGPDVVPHYKIKLL